jgi:hypothetical protein
VDGERREMRSWLWGKRCRTLWGQCDYCAGYLDLPFQVWTLIVDAAGKAIPSSAYSRQTPDSALACRTSGAECHLPLAELAFLDLIRSFLFVEYANCLQQLCWTCKGGVFVVDMESFSATHTRFCLHPPSINRISRQLRNPSPTEHRPAQYVVP